MSKPISIAVVGAGSRGAGYSTYAGAHPAEARIVAVAEPQEFHREQMVRKYGIPKENTFSDWRQMAEKKKLADVVIIATQDAGHAEPAIAFAGLGYHMLLEKPMAPNADDCRKIVDAAVRAKIVFAVCHVLRYTRYTSVLKKMVDSGAIGDVVSLQHLEPVGYWHQAHSFVRGNWRNEKESSPMLLAKSCHDLDWIRYMMGVKCLAVSSFGALKHFRKEEKPAGAGSRCLACAVEAGCPYSAKRIYLGRIKSGQTTWPVSIITTDLTEEGVTEALRKGPYGRCVYECDNDVVDNQVVNMLFDGSRTASFTMTAFTDMASRRTRIFGTKGMLTGNGRTIERYDFLTDKTSSEDTEAGDSSLLAGHGGGDYGLMKAFVAAVAQNDPSLILSGPKETLETHLMVFAAEEARRKNLVVPLAY